MIPPQPVVHVYKNIPTASTALSVSLLEITLRLVLYLYTLYIVYVITLQLVYTCMYVIHHTLYSVHHSLSEPIRDHSPSSTAYAQCTNSLVCILYEYFDRSIVERVRSAAHNLFLPTFIGVITGGAGFRKCRISCSMCQAFASIFNPTSSQPSKILVFSKSSFTM